VVFEVEVMKLKSGNLLFTSDDSKRSSAAQWNITQTLDFIDQFRQSLKVGFPLMFCNFLSLCLLFTFFCFGIFY